MTLAPTTIDDDLVVQIARGDQAAFSDLYQRYFQGIYDFALRTTRSSDLAEDVVQHTFTRAWEYLRRDDPPQNLKAWLYTVARNAAIDEVRRGKRLLQDTPDEDGTSAIANAVDPDRLSDPEAVVRDRQLVDLVWEAASGLNEREYSLLDMHLRQDLNPDEIAAAMDLRRDHVYTLLSRLRDSVEESVTFLVLMRRRGECPALDALLGSRSDGPLTPVTRKLIRKHVETCERCRERRKRFVSPVEILGGLAVVPTTIDVRDWVWRRVEEEIAAPAPTPSSPSTPGAVGSWTATLGMAAAAVLSVVALITVMLRPTESADAQPPQPLREQIMVAESALAPCGESGTGDLPRCGHAAQELQPPPTPPLLPTLAPAQSFEDPEENAEPNAPEALISIIPIPPRDLIAHPSPPSARPPTATPTPPAPTPTRVVAIARAIAPPEELDGMVEEEIAPLSLSPEPFIPTSLPVAPASPSAIAVATVEPTATPIAATATPVAPTPTEIAVSLDPGTATPTNAGLPAPPTMPRATRTPTPTVTTPPPTSTPTTQPSATSTATFVPSATPSATPTASCAELSAADLTAMRNPASGQVALSWSAKGGCAPIGGTIAARYAQQQPYHTYQISTRSGSLTDTPPQRCEGTFTVQYALTLHDASGAAASDSASVQITWLC